MLSSSNRLDEAKRQRDSTIQHCNVSRSSTGLAAVLLRSRRLSGGFKKLVRDVVFQRRVAISCGLKHRMAKPIDFIGERIERTLANPFNIARFDLYGVLRSFESDSRI